MSEHLLVARYENREGLLLISGVPLTFKVISDMPCSKKAYTPTGTDTNCGRVAIGVESLSKVPISLEQLTPYFSRLGFQLEFRGQTAVPKNLLAELKKPSHLCGLVIQTMEREVMGELTQEALTEIDYNAVYKRLCLEQ